VRLPGVIRWIGLALLGLAIAAAVAIAAGNLASQQIGIAAESISAGDQLAPPPNVAKPGGESKPARPKRHRGQGPGGSRESTTPSEPTTPASPGEPTTTAPVEPTTPSGPSEGPDEHTGQGGGGGEGGGDD
jgi:hypothetical protein